MDAPEGVRVAVLGGGITGLCAGHKLAAALGREQVLVLERSDRAGGFVQTETVDGYRCDAGPNGFLDKEPLMLEWIDALGLTGELQQANEAAARRFILKNRRLVELLPPPRFLLSPALSIVGRARLLREPFVEAKTDNAPESVWDFAARRIGAEAADTLVSAMVTGIFGGDAKALSLEHCFPRMAAMEREHGSLFRAMRAQRNASGAGPMGPGGTLTTFATGIGRLTECAAELLGDRVRTGFECVGIEHDGADYRIVSATGETVRAEAVVVALPAHTLSPLLAGMAPALGGALRGVGQASIAVVCAGYRRSAVGHDMNGFGFLTPPKHRRRVLGCIWASSVFPESCPEDRVFLRTLFGGTLDPEAVGLDDAALLASIEEEIHPLLGIREAPEFVKIFRHAEGIAQYGLDHQSILDAVDATEAKYRGLFFAGNAYRGVSLNDCVVSAQRAVDRVVEALAI